MTREEAIKWFKESAFYHKDHEPFNMAISALEQQPCEDAVSREAVCDYIAEYVNNEYSTQAECEMVDYMIDGIQHLPSVTVRQIDNHLLDGIHAMGYREGHKDAKVEYEQQTGKTKTKAKKDVYTCSICGKGEILKNGHCSWCGADMRGAVPQESK